MPAARHTGTVDAPVEELWARLADIASWPRWLHVPYATEAVSPAAPGPVGLGTEFTLKGSLPYRLFARITEWQERQRLAFEIYRSEYPSDRLFFRRATIAVELEQLDEARTRATCTHRVEGKGVLGAVYMATVFRPFLSTNAQRIVQSLRLAG